MLNPSMMRGAMELLIDWRSASSIFATLMLINTLTSHIPLEVRMFARKLFAHIFTYLKPTNTIIIEDSDTFGGANELYDSAQLYLGTHCLSHCVTVRLFKSCTTDSPLASLPDSHTVNDTFQGVPIKWTSHKQERSDSGSGHFRNRRGSDGSDRRCLNVEFHQKHRNLVFNTYIPHILTEAARLRSHTKERRLYTNRYCSSGDDFHRSSWSSRTFSHPSNFDTIALDPSLREEIRADLLRFVSRKDHYLRAGRAWKRGYLLHGPPGTGKTSLVAAIANLLEFDVYDLELTAVHTNSQLRRLLVSTTPKSVIVIEDIDCSLDLSDRKKKQMEENQEEGMKDHPQKMSTYREALNLSGVLNFVDGLWSSCVGERLMIFTTNHPERLDPALLRPGRMDKKIELGYCGAPAFRMLVKNYLCLREEEVDRKDTRAEIERLLEEVKVTPAEIAEVFMGCDGDSDDAALGKLVLELHQRKMSSPPKKHVALAVSTEKCSLEETIRDGSTIKQLVVIPAGCS
ncbi:P-loop containing nucleoside triphosphate hydrolases superfamily protein [Rhynchospora pubera]|uniref:P-loop containing nucleoside triphosphate hydrolases superfamily protein n=1 Tax=Rhynchospora pubera TaxID=906938 RepID=A0AAV8HFA1_9POAL|nr:P-loop containing nucleoside triphosphate hydrolases superfamily protein [Rhynchospora pubera]